MSIKAMTRVWQHSQQRGNALLLMLAIADHANDDGFTAWPSIRTLAQKGRTSERQVYRLVSQLAEDGELEIRHRAGPHGTNLYRVLTADTVSPLTTCHPDTGVTKTLTPVSPEPSLTVKDSSSSRSTKPNDHDLEFDDWWKQVPRKVGKGHARKAFKAARKKASLEDLTAGIKGYAQETAETDAHFVKHPASWLNGECWSDEPATAAHGSGEYGWEPPS